MNWDDLRFLLALRKGGSLAAAARTLGVDQTTVGRRLSALEEALGSRLFERRPTGHRLTEAGRRACELGLAMESAADAVERELGGKDVGFEGRVRITAPAGFIPTIAPVLAELRAQHPRLEFDLFADTASLDLAKREADVAVRMVKPDAPSLVGTKVTSLPWALFASDAYLRRAGEPTADFAGHTLVGYGPPIDRSPGATYFATHAKGARIAVRTNNVLAALDCAAAGLGIAAVPVLLAAREPGLVRLAGPREVGSSPVYLVAHADVRRVPRVRAALDQLARGLRAAAAREGRASMR